MTSPLLLDTHVWLWWLLGQAELTARERAALAAAGTPPALSAMEALPLPCCIHGFINWKIRLRYPVLKSGF